jgi:hypothetical protein
MKVRVLRNSKGEILAAGYEDPDQKGTEDNVPIAFGPVADEDGLEVGEVELPSRYLPSGEQNIEDFIRQLGSRFKKGD